MEGRFRKKDINEVSNEVSDNITSNNVSNDTITNAVGSFMDTIGTLFGR